MDAVRVFACDGANAYLIIGLLLGGFRGEVVYLSGARARIRRLWFLGGMVVGVLAAGIAFWLLNGSCS